MELYKKYAQLNDKLKELEEEKDLLKEAILKDMKSNKTIKEQKEFGTFTMCNRSSWTYSDKIKTQEEKIKIAKFKEQEQGIADEKVTNYLLFKTN